MRASRALIAGLGLLLTACGGDELVDQSPSSERQPESWWQKVRAPHPGRIDVTVPGLHATGLSDAWQQYKTIIRKGTHLSINAWVTFPGGGAIRVELYRWDGTVWGWDRLIARAAATTSLAPCMSHRGIADQDLAGSFRALTDWEVPQDGVYLLAFQSAVGYEILFETAEKYYDAASCQDDPGICRRLDADFRCAEAYHIDENGVRGDLEAPAFCTGAPNPSWGYVTVD